MMGRGCFSTTTPAQPRRPCRPRHLYAVPRTSLQCVCTRRRNCIEQLSPSPEYAPGVSRFPVRNHATIKLTHYHRLTLTVAVLIMFFSQEPLLKIMGERSDGNDSHHPPCGPRCFLRLGRA